MLVVVAIVVVVADVAFCALTAAGVNFASGTFGDRLAVFVVGVVVAAATATTIGASFCGIAISKRRGRGLLYATRRLKACAVNFIYTVRCDCTTIIPIRASAVCT